MSHVAFICHSARDKRIADAACTALEAHRISCWIAPRDVMPGAEWGESIIDAINGSQVFVLIFSRHANESPQVRREVERAVSKGKILIPFRIEDVLPSGAMEYALGNTHWLDALTPPVEASLGRLAETVARVVNRQGSTPLWVEPQAVAPVVHTPSAFAISRIKSWASETGRYAGLGRSLKIAASLLVAAALTAALSFGATALLAPPGH
jgi:hypothetical protein